MQQIVLPPIALGLISMPWAIFNRPSIQLASLKTYLDAQEPRTVTTTLFHPYLTVAADLKTETYHYLAKDSWAGEALYSPLLFSEQYASAEKLFQSRCKKETGLQHLTFQSCTELLDQSLDKWLENIDFSAFDLIGFSICFNQLIASLTAAERIKKRCPNLPIVIGGSGCVGDIGPSLLNTFPQIDYVISGEGENALLQLCESLRPTAASVTLPAGIISRQSERCTTKCCDGISDINSLPPPDYHPYFEEMKQIFPNQSFIPVLPIEFSRGCWWNKCSFCNLNLQWHGYRWKKATTMLRELKEQSREHQCLDFCFTDNALPPKETDTFFSTLAETETDYDFFAEVRVITDPDTLRRYRKGGLTTIQVGIESLSTSLLKKMNKGTTAIENIAAMRQSAEAGIQLEGNLITDFPGSTTEEVAETLKNLDFILPYTPLSAASFFLGHGSPVASNPTAYGIVALTWHAKNQQLFPKDTLNGLSMLIKGYRGDRLIQKKKWQEVKMKIESWHQFHRSRNSNHPPLSYRDGNQFLLIRQEQMKGPTLQHRLQGNSRKLYLFCRRIRSMKEISREFPTIKKSTMRRFFHDLHHKKLLFQENDHFLALAVKH